MVETHETRLKKNIMSNNNGVESNISTHGYSYSTSRALKTVMVARGVYFFWKESRFLGQQKTEGKNLHNKSEPGVKGCKFPSTTSDSARNHSKECCDASGLDTSAVTLLANPSWCAVKKALICGTEAPKNLSALLMAKSSVNHVKNPVKVQWNTQFLISSPNCTSSTRNEAGCSGWSRAKCGEHSHRLPAWMHPAL